MGAKPDLQIVEQRFGLGLSDPRPLIGRFAAPITSLPAAADDPTSINPDSGHQRPPSTPRFAIRIKIKETRSGTPDAHGDDACIDNWLKVLKADIKAIFTAAGQAAKATDYLAGLQANEAAEAAAQAASLFRPLRTCTSASSTVAA